MSCLTRRLVLASVCLLVLGSATHLHAQAVSLSTTNHGFGNVAVGTSSTKSVRLTNSGTASLVITSISQPSAPFSEPNNCPSPTASLAPHAFCTHTNIRCYRRAGVRKTKKQCTTLLEDLCCDFLLSRMRSIGCYVS